MALPDVPYAQEAEAAGCGAALDLLLQEGHRIPRRAIISGTCRWSFGMGLAWGGSGGQPCYPVWTAALGPS